MAPAGRTRRRGWAPHIASGAARAATFALLGLLAGACSEGNRGDGDAPLADAGSDAAVDPGATRLRFEVPRGVPAPLGALPWPSSLYRGEDQRISVGEIAGSDDAQPYLGRLRASLAELDGFGATTPIYFFFDGSLDPESLPADPDATLDPLASVFLLDVDPNSPTAFERVPVEIHYEAGAHRLALRPLRGSALSAGRRYAAVVTGQLRDAGGDSVVASDDFVALRTGTLPEDAAPALVAAFDSHAPILDAIERGGVARGDVRGVAAFRVQGARADLGDALAAATEQVPGFVLDAPREALDELLGTPVEPLAGLDVPGGVLHDRLGAMVQGTLMAKNFVSPEVGVHGGFQRDGGGALRVQRVEDVPFTLWLPPADLIQGPVPVVVYQHGLGGQRSESVVLANRLAAAGFALIAMDLPYHGGRAGVPDTTNNFTGADGADGFGDGGGDFAGVGDTQAARGPLHPAYFGGAVFQSLADLATLLTMLRDGDVSGGLAGTSYDGISFATQRIAFVGVGMGGALGLSLSAADAGLGIGAVQALFASGHVTDGWAGASGQSSLFEALVGALGSQDGADTSVWWPNLSLYQTLIDAADPIVLAAGLRRLPVNALLVAASHDRLHTVEGVEAIAKVVGAQLLQGDPEALPALPVVDAVPPVSGNYVAADKNVTRVLTRVDDATELAFVRRYTPSSANGERAPDGDPPLDALLEQTAEYLTTYLTCEPQGADCPASVPSLQ